MPLFSLHSFNAKGIKMLIKVSKRTGRITVDGKPSNIIPMPIRDMVAEPMPNVKGFVRVKGMCMLLRREFVTTPLRLDGLRNFINGQKASEAFPEVAPLTRRFLETGISPAFYQK